MNRPLGSKGTPRPARLRPVLLRRKGARPPALRGFEIRAARPQSLRAFALSGSQISESRARDETPRAARPRSRLPRRCAARARRLAAAPPARAASSPRARARLGDSCRPAAAPPSQSARGSVMPLRFRLATSAACRPAPGENSPKLHLARYYPSSSRTPLQPALARTRHARRRHPRRQRATEPLCPLARRWSGELMPAARPPEHTRPRRRAGAYGAAATASLLRATDRADAPLERVYDQRTELVWLCVLGAFEAHRIAVDLRHPRSVRRRSSRPRSFSSRQQVKGR